MEKGAKLQCANTKKMFSMKVQHELNNESENN